MKELLKMKKTRRTGVILCCIFLSALLGITVYAVTCTLSHVSSHSSNGYTCTMGSISHQRVTLPITGATECFYGGTEPSSSDMDIIMHFAKHIFDETTTSNLSVYYFLYGEHDDNIGSHEGIDLQHTGNTSRTVDSPLNGSVIYTGGTYGKVCILLDSGDTLTFMHLENIASLGSSISAGTIMGNQGRVGLSSNSGKHVHVQLEDGQTSTCSTGKNDQITSLRPYDTWRSQLVHTYGTWLHNATYHYHTCTYCGYTENGGTHYATTADPTHCAVCGRYGTNWPLIRADIS